MPYVSKVRGINLMKLAAEVIMGNKIPERLLDLPYGNFVGVKSENILFSQRLDSRTYLVQNKLYGKNKSAGVFEGSDKEFIKISTDILRRLEIPLSEVREKTVFQENTQIAQVDPKTGSVRLEESQKGQRFAGFSRMIDGVPVFSSSAILTLTRDGKIGFMELHWPEIPKHVMKEAQRLKYMVEKGWEPPKQKGGIVEMVEAGIVHSAALGFIMDIYPAIRVIYMPEDKKMWRKLTLFLDRDGKPVPNPREFDIPPQKYEERRKK